MRKYSVEEIDDYRGKITPEQSKELIEHCNRHNMYPTICAWYDDVDDLCDDYKEHCDYDRETTLELYEGDSMFCTFSNGEIVKIA